MNQLRSNPETAVIFTYVEGASNKDFLRIIPFALHKQTKRKEYEVHFSSPHRIGEYLQISGSRKDITKGLRQQYDNFISEVTEGSSN